MTHRTDRYERNGFGFLIFRADRHFAKYGALQSADDSDLIATLAAAMYHLATLTESLVVQRNGITFLYAWHLSRPYFSCLLEGHRCWYSAHLIREGQSTLNPTLLASVTCYRLFLLTCAIYADVITFHISQATDTPARRAGLKDGDLIVSVNGERVLGLGHDAVVHVLTGVGQTFTLELGTWPEYVLAFCSFFFSWKRRFGMLVYPCLSCIVLCCRSTR